jgi:outer membrane immunogenic protein
MLKRLLVATTALIGMAGIASAADLPYRAPAPVYAPPAFTWTGFYVGVNAGGAWGSQCSDFSPYYTNIPTGWVGGSCSNGNGNGAFIGGGQIGYNWQTGAFVFGLEADFNGISSRNHNSSYVLANNFGRLPAGTYDFSGQRDPSYLGTVRLRFGWALDHVLFYVTGGLAYGNTSGNVSVAYYAPNATTPTAYYSAGSSNNSGIGWTVGGGMEYAFTDNWTAKIEYLYANLGNDNGNSNGWVCNGVDCLNGVTWNGGNRRANINVMRVGVNYKF